MLPLYKDRDWYSPDDLLVDRAQVWGPYCPVFQVEWPRYIHTIYPPPREDPWQ